MKTCPVCGLDVEDSYMFCPDDGSSLVEAQTHGSSFTADQADSEPTMEAGAPGHDTVVSYCGECAAEYPMTFVECPVHHALLTRTPLPTIAPRMVKSAEPVSIEPNPEGEADECALVSGTFWSDRSSACPQPAEPLGLGWTERDERVSSPAAPSLLFQRFGTKRKSRSWSPSILAGDNFALEHDANGRGDSISQNDAPSFRIVAAAIVMGLVLFCIAAVFIFFSAGGRTQTVARASRVPESAAVQEPPFVSTPDSARDYEEEKPQQPTNDVTPAASPGPSMPREERTGTESRNTKPETGGAKSAPVSMYRTSSVGSAGTSTGMRTPSPDSESSPRLDPGNVDARLIRVRSMRTGSGVRYDLTFDLKDESGRHSQWERMLVSSRSGSGVSHTQTVPFVHRLGANGALTFTVSVEMRGNSNLDWRGRVVCTTSGADIDGRPLRASFGANVTP